MVHKQKISLDITKLTAFEYQDPIEAKQGDNRTRFVEITLLNNGVAFNPGPGATAKFRALKPDGHSCYNPATISPEGTVTVELTEQVLAVSGIVRADVMISEQETDRISTATFFIRVEKSPVGKNIPSSDEFLALVGLIEKSNQLVGEYETALAQLQAIQADVTSKQISADKSASSSNAAMKRAEAAEAEVKEQVGIIDTKAEEVAQALTALNNAITEASTATEEAATIKSGLESSINLAKSTSKELDIGVATAEKAIAGIDKATGKTVYYVDLLYRTSVVNAKSAAEVDALFKEWWWINWSEGKTSRTDLLDRWFGSVLDDGRIHGVKLPLFSTSTSPTGELTDDSVGLICEPSTDTKAGRDDFAQLPQFWCVEVSAEKNPDGSHEIYAVEHIDPIGQVRSGEHLCWVLQKNTYTKEWTDDQYHYMQMQCHPADGFTQWPQGTDRTGRVYGYIGNPKYAAGVSADGRITCGTGLLPVTYTSHNTGVGKWRGRGTQYSGVSGCWIKWLISMIWLKYAKKSNSGTIEGCTSAYWENHNVAVSEVGVKRIILPTGDKTAVLPNMALDVKGAGIVKVLSVEDVNIEGTGYIAVNLDMDATMDTTAGTTTASRKPYPSGWTDMVLGNDGSYGSNTSGMYPGRIQKVEFQNGAYMILSDELWQWSQPGGEGTDFHFDCYTCHDQTKVSPSSITSDYTKQEDLTLTFPGDTAEGWWYNEDALIGRDRGVLWPRPSKKAGSGTGLKSGFYVQPRSSGIRAAWVFAYLYSSGYAGLPARYSYYSTSSNYWSACLGSPGLSG